MSALSPFNYWKELMPRIEGDAGLMARLKGYATESLALPWLGEGSVNEHFALGMLTAGDWIAIRHAKIDTFLSKPLCEDYIKHAEGFYVQGEPVPNFCGGVEVERGCDLEYFLLVENIRRDGSERFEEAVGRFGTGFVGNRAVIYDLDDQSSIDMPGRTTYQYMLPEHMIHIKV